MGDPRFIIKANSSTVYDGTDSAEAARRYLFGRGGPYTQTVTVGDKDVTERFAPMMTTVGVAELLDLIAMGAW